MLLNRELERHEINALGVFGRVHDDSSEPFGKRTGVILVHGRAGNETLMWVFSKVIRELEPIVFAPRALLEDPIGGYSWWNFESREEGSESPAPKATTLDHLEPGLTAISQAAHAIVDLYGVDPSRMIGIGFSQGAALLGSLSLMEPGIFSKVALLAGFLPKSVQEFFLKQDISQIPDIFMSHGIKDRIITFDKAVQSKEYLISKGGNVHFHSDEVGHKISSSGMRELKDWLKKDLV
jgi:predicted esterase